MKVSLLVHGACTIQGWQSAPLGGCFAALLLCFPFIPSSAHSVVWLLPGGRFGGGGYCADSGKLPHQLFIRCLPSLVETIFIFLWLCFQEYLSVNKENFCHISVLVSSSPDKPVNSLMFYPHGDERVLYSCVCVYIYIYVRTNKLSPSPLASTSILKALLIIFNLCICMCVYICMYNFVIVSLPYLKRG